MKIREKKQILATWIEILVHQGYDLTPFLGKPLNWFNYKVLQNEVKEYNLKIEQEIL